jgi:hypothetical protein
MTDQPGLEPGDYAVDLSRLGWGEVWRSMVANHARRLGRPGALVLATLLLPLGVWVTRANRLPAAQFLFLPSAFADDFCARETLAPDLAASLLPGREAAIGWFRVLVLLLVLGHHARARWMGRLFAPAAAEPGT